jgi:hypothetical protein
MEATRHIYCLSTLSFSVVEYLTKKEGIAMTTFYEWVSYHLTNMFTVFVAVPLYCWTVFIDWLKREW